MKKTFSLEIKTPCHENIQNMTSNLNGFFCGSCAKNVIDLSTKSKSEVAQFISKNKNNSSICARLKTSQLEEEFEINEISKTANLKYAVAIAATVLLTSPILAQEKTPPKTEVSCAKPNRIVMGKMAYVKPATKIIPITIEGTILDVKTIKPLSEKQFPNLTIYINGAKEGVKVNYKTGHFSIPVMYDENTKILYISLTSDDLRFSKNITIDAKQIKNNVLKQTIFVKEDEFMSTMILGGLGINYTDNKKTKLI
jgi:hypothetical protein